MRRAPSSKSPPGDPFVGTAGDDVLHGDGTSFGGPDGSGPDDRLLGGDGDDLLFGDHAAYDAPSGGRDTLDGQRGNDTIYGGGGIDVISGGSGDDVLFGGFGKDTLFGSAGDDRLVGGPGADLLIGGTTRGEAWGLDTADYSTSGRRVFVDLGRDAGFEGDAEGDTLLNIHGLRGSEFGDVMRGDAEANRIEGGGGVDVLGGGLNLFGQDTLLGGADADIFHVHMPHATASGSWDGWVRIADFSAAERDRIVLHGLHFADARAIGAAQDGADVVVTVDRRMTDDPGGATGPEIVCVLGNTDLAGLSGSWLVPTLQDWEFP